MAVRRPRRRRPTWLLLAILLSLVVVAIDAGMSARSEAPSQRLAQLAYLDQIRPLVQRSSEQGADLEDARTAAAELGRDGIRRRLDRLTREAQAVSKAVQRIEPAPASSTAHAVLVATLVIRARAAAAVGEGLVAALGTDQPEAAINQLVEAGQDLAAADRDYLVFLDAVPRADNEVPLPTSRWLIDPVAWTRPDLGVFVGALRSSTALAPIHDTAVVVVTTDPMPVGMEGLTKVLPPLKVLRLQVVVANVGNEAERRVTVVAGVGALDGPVDTARDFVDLAPGQRKVVSLAVRPRVGIPSTLTVRVEPVAGESAVADNEQVSSVLVR